MQFVENGHEDVASDEADRRFRQQHRRVLRAKHVNLGRHPQHRHPREVAERGNVLKLQLSSIIRV